MTCDVGPKNNENKVQEYVNIAFQTSSSIINPHDFRFLRFDYALLQLLPRTRLVRADIVDKCKPGTLYSSPYRLTPSTL